MDLANRGRRFPAVRSKPLEAPMKIRTLATASMLCALQTLASSHGGSYRGPGDVVPPGGGGTGGGGGGGPPSGPHGPSGPNPGPTTGPGGTLPGPSTGTTRGTTTNPQAEMGPDLTLWSFWWEFNKEPYLNVKTHVYDVGESTGDDGWFRGTWRVGSRDTLKPSEEQIRQKIVPALLAALEKETNNDIVTGCLIALAKIGDAKSESGESRFEKVIARFLADKNQEISETAAVALGILANPSS